LNRAQLGLDELAVPEVGLVLGKVVCVEEVLVADSWFQMKLENNILGSCTFSKATEFSGRHIRKFSLSAIS
jgi:hypothetical protein